MFISLTLFALSAVLFVLASRAEDSAELTADDLQSWAIIDGEYIEYTSDEIVARLRDKVAGR